MKKIIKILLLNFVIFSLFNIANASLNIDTAVDAPTSCTVTDADGIIHDYGNSYLAICAFEKALSNGSISNIQLSNQYPGLGLFVTSINNVTADPNSQYWTLYQNGNYASSGITQLPVTSGDILMFQLHDFSDNNLGDQITLHINSLITTPAGSGPLISYTEPIISPIIIANTTPTTIEIKPTFDNKKALDFLITQQKENGSFGEDLYTDWITLALVGGNYQDQVLKLIKYLGNSKLENPTLTDYERRAMALMALGLNPYKTNNENYINKIITSFDGKQFGDLNEYNDDIFALIVLQNAGYKQNEKIISDDISFILNQQKENGSWGDSIDMTGAAIESLASFSNVTNVNESLINAKKFLKQNQKENSGWGNASSTAWALEGIIALGEKQDNWIKNENTPSDYLATIQDTDGGIKNENIKNKIWETAYVASILSGKNWNQLLQKFEKPEMTIVTNLPKKNLKKQELTATTINAISNPIPEAKKDNSKKNWFIKLIENIFNIF